MSNQPQDSTNEIKHELERILAAMQKNNASDLHLKSGVRPIMRIAGIPRHVGSKVLDEDAIRRMLYEILTEPQINEIETKGDVDLAYSVSGVGRFRLNIFRQRGVLSAAIRRVNVVIPTFDELHLPPALERLAKYTHGLVLVAGATGAGKSTTIASMLEYINEHERVHIMTIEDPIEYVFRDKKGFVSQREIGIDVENFGEALKKVLRQDPDVILCGEIRDRETGQFALTAAETGHLVYGTIHAASASQVIIRAIDMFQPEQQDNIRLTLATALRGVAVQKLLPSTREGIARVPAVELMFVTPVIQKLIKDREDKKIQDVVRSSSEDGMMDFNQSLVRLVREGFISKTIAMEYSDNPDQLVMNLKGIFLDEDKGIAG